MWNFNAIGMAIFYSLTIKELLRNFLCQICSTQGLGEKGGLSSTGSLSNTIIRQGTQSTESFIQLVHCVTSFPQDLIPFHFNRYKKVIMSNCPSGLSRAHHTGVLLSIVTIDSPRCNLPPRSRRRHLQNFAHWCLEQSQGPCPHTGMSIDGCWSVRS